MRDSMKTVVFVDDSATALSSSKIATTSMPINIKQYQNPIKAIEDIKNKCIEPDLIITDLYMPDIDGFEFLKILRSLESTKTTPVMMLTTEDRDSTKVEGKELGLTGWLTKPFTSAQLVNAITRILRIQ
jgi:two-component system chemotaxis response regulator CheY